jgi:hypothetical protein
MASPMLKNSPYMHMWAKGYPKTATGSVLAMVWENPKKNMLNPKESRSLKYEQGFREEEPICTYYFLDCSLAN